MICMLSLFGIFQTALIVGVLSEALVIPPDEKRILASVEKQRKKLYFHFYAIFRAVPYLEPRLYSILGADQIRRHAAAKLIQATWRQHRYNKTCTILIYAFTYIYIQTLSIVNTGLLIIKSIIYTFWIEKATAFLSEQYISTQCTYICVYITQQYLVQKRTAVIEPNWYNPTNALTRSFIRLWLIIESKSTLFKLRLISKNYLNFQNSRRSKL